MTVSRGSPWAWLPLSILLSISILWQSTDEFSLHLEPYLFIPLLTGWLASRFGLRITGLLLVLGLLAALDIRLALFETLSFEFGLPEWVYFVALGTAVAFSRQKPGIVPKQIFSDRWQWLRWLLPLAMYLAVFTSHDLSWKVSRSVEIGTNPGLLLFVTIIAASIRPRAASVALRSIFLTGNRAYQNILTLGLLGILALACVFYIDPDFDNWVALSFGFRGGWSVMLAVSFLLPVFGLLGWRSMIVFIVLLVAADAVIDQVVEWVQTILPDEPVVPSPYGTITVTGSRWNSGRILLPVRLDVIYCVCAALLATMISPFWQNRDPELLRTRRTSLFLCLTLVVLILGLSFMRYGFSGPGAMLLGGAAYVIGLVWRVRGLIAGPFITLFACLLSLSLMRLNEISGPSGFELVSMGLVAFPFAFFGLLSNRYTPDSALPMNKRPQGASE